MRHSLFAAVMSLAVTLTSIAQPAAADAIPVNGHERTYTVVAPNTTARVPLVMVLHGLGGNGREVAAYTGWEMLARAKGFAAVFPNAIAGQWHGLDDAKSPGKSDDVVFLN